jgi:hypothetical protein
MTDVRRAEAGDAPEVARLRGVMLAAMRGPEGAAPGPWVQASIASLREWIGDPDVAILVVEKTDGLAACAIGVIERSLGFVVRTVTSMRRVRSTHT